MTSSTNEYQARITSQHIDKPKFMAMVGTLTDMAISLRQAVEAIPGQFDLDRAVGAQLDIVGLWVGQSRFISATIPAEFFGFSDTPSGQNFGEEGMPWIGGRWYEEGESTSATSRLNDALYRLVIKARIVKNHYRGGYAGILAGLRLVFGDDVSNGAGLHMTVQDLGNMAMRINVGRPLSAVEKALVRRLDIIPRPAGVLIDGFGTFDTENGWLGFEDQIEYGAVTFAEEGYIGPRAHLMEEF